MGHPSLHMAPLVTNQKDDFYYCMQFSLDPLRLRNAKRHFKKKVAAEPEKKA